MVDDTARVRMRLRVVRRSAVPVCGAYRGADNPASALRVAHQDEAPEGSTVSLSRADRRWFFAWGMALMAALVACTSLLVAAAIWGEP